MKPPAKKGNMHWNNTLPRAMLRALGKGYLCRELQQSANIFMDLIYLKKQFTNESATGVSHGPCIIRSSKYMSRALFKCTAKTPRCHGVVKRKRTWHVATYFLYSLFGSRHICSLPSLLSLPRAFWQCSISVVVFYGFPRAALSVYLFGLEPKTRHATKF